MRSDHQMKFRMPVEMKDWLEREAARNMRSMTAEIVISIRDRMERAKAATGEGFADTAPAAVTNRTACQGGPITHGL